MNLVSSERTEKSSYALEFSVDKATFEAAVNKVYRKQVKNINIPGFRKGKAPRSVVERMYGKGVFYEEAANDLLPAAYEEALKAADINPVGRATFDIKDINDDGITFTADVPVKPLVTVEGYKGIEAVKTVEPVTDVEIDNELKVVRERNSRTLDIEDAPAETGNTVKIDYAGTVDGVAFDGGTAEDYFLKLGSGSFIPGFEDQIVGHSIGDAFDVNVTFPDDYHAKELAGKAAVFAVKLKGIQKVELPELDDDFAKDVSEFDTLAEYKADISANIAKRHEDAAEAAFEETITKALAEKLGGEAIPDAMIDAEVENRLRDMDNRLRMNGLNLDTYLKYTGSDLDKARADLRPQSEQFIKVRLALDKIAELEAFEVTQEETDAEYARLAESYKMELDQVKAAVPADSVNDDIKAKKAMDCVKLAAVAPAADEQ